MMRGSHACQSVLSESFGMRLRRPSRPTLFLTILCSLFPVLRSHAAAQQAEDPFALGVRTSEPISPAEQQATFSVPQGFTVELVASEPNVAKPMNLAFDKRGRLWVSSSLEYPFAAAPEQTPRDTIRIMEGNDKWSWLGRIPSSGRT
jgi:hypothetical protein